MKKIYNTIKYEKILEYFKQDKNISYSASDILEKLKQDNIDINKSTVYRILEKLYKNGIVIKNINNSREKSYRLKLDKCKNHIHLKCLECGKIIHLDCPCTEKIFETLNEKHGFEIDYKETLIQGKCKDCQNKS